MLSLQRSAGNAAAARLAERLRPPPPPRPPVAAARPVLARTLRVKNPTSPIPRPGGVGMARTNAATVRDYLLQICGAGAVAVNGGTGAVTLNAGFCVVPQGQAGGPAHASATPAGCTCLCDLIASAHDWRIEIDDGDWPHTDFDSDARAETPGRGSGGKVTAPSPNNPTIYGAGTDTGAELDTAPWLVLAHELCGHAWLGDRGIHRPDHHPRRGEGGHQLTVGRENLIRAEHHIAARGSFRDAHCGESYTRAQAGSPAQWSTFHAACVAWRDRYNRAHGTNYTINQRIP
jgi:hypothetical protein